LVYSDVVIRISSDQENTAWKKYHLLLYGCRHVKILQLVNKMCSQQACSEFDNAIKLVTSCWQLVPNLLQQLGTSSANTTCRQLLNRFVTTCAFLRVYTSEHFTIVPSCQQVWNKLLTTLLILSGLLQTCKAIPTSPIQSWYNNTVTTLCRQPCNTRLHQIC
jgi:hypothetical protein